VNLNGITTILSGKRAFVLVQEQGKQPESKMLKEGERDGQIEVISINESSGSVKLKVGDKETELTFEKDGIKLPLRHLPQHRAGAPVPSVPIMPGAVIPSAGSKTASITPSGSTSGGVNSLMPTRPLRSIHYRQ
jgi:hypothetical protein